MGLPEAVSRKARQEGDQGPQGCGQEVRNRRPGQGWPVCRHLQPDELAKASQLEVRPGRLGKNAFLWFYPPPGTVGISTIRKFTLKQQECISLVLSPTRDSGDKNHHEIHS